MSQRCNSRLTASPCTHVSDTSPVTNALLSRTTVLLSLLTFSRMMKCPAGSKLEDLTSASRLCPLESRRVKEPDAPVALMPVKQSVKVEADTTTLKPEAIFIPVVHPLQFIPLNSHCWPSTSMPITPPLKVRSFMITLLLLASAVLYCVVRPLWPVEKLGISNMTLVS